MTAWCNCYGKEETHLKRKSVMLEVIFEEIIYRIIDTVNYEEVKKKYR